MAKSELLVFTKPDCPLCDELKDELRHLDISFTECSIVTRLGWLRRYRHRIPVVMTADGREYDPPFPPDRVARLFR